MKLAVDVHLDGTGGQVAGVAFDEWGAAEAERTFITRLAVLDKPPKGEPDLRELHAILELLRQHVLQPEVILIDGFVFLDAQETPGLGQRLYQALGGRASVVGLSKTAMADTPAQFELNREEETKPLIVTCVGIDLGAAKARVRAMHGKRRVPTLMKLVARLAKGTVA